MKSRAARRRPGPQEGRPIRARKLVAEALTILAIAGTLTACGRYGPPVRPAPTIEPADRGPIDESLDRSPSRPVEGERSDAGDDDRRP